MQDGGPGNATSHKNCHGNVSLNKNMKTTVIEWIPKNYNLWGFNMTPIHLNIEQPLTNFICILMDEITFFHWLTNKKHIRSWVLVRLLPMLSLPLLTNCIFWKLKWFKRPKCFSVCAPCIKYLPHKSKTIFTYSTLHLITP